MEPLWGLDYQRWLNENQSTADSGERARTAKPLLMPADADTDAGCLAMREVSSLSVSDTVMEHCPPPDSDRDWWAMQTVLLGRPDSDAHLLLTDDSLSQLSEPDRPVKAEDESSCKLALISVHMNTRNTGGQELFCQQVLPWERAGNLGQRVVDERR